MPKPPTPGPEHTHFGLLTFPPRARKVFGMEPHTGHSVYLFTSQTEAYRELSARLREVRKYDPTAKGRVLPIAQYDHTMADLARAREAKTKRNAVVARRIRAEQERRYRRHSRYS